MLTTKQVLHLIDASMENPFESQPSIFVVDDELEIVTDPRAALEAARASARPITSFRIS
jgi:hypothetical protein